MTRQSGTHSKATACHLCQQKNRLETTNPPAMKKERQRAATLSKIYAGWSQQASEGKDHTRRTVWLPKSTKNLSKKQFVVTNKEKPKRCRDDFVASIPCPPCHTQLILAKAAEHVHHRVCDYMDTRKLMWVMCNSISVYRLLPFAIIHCSFHQTSAKVVFCTWACKTS